MPALSSPTARPMAGPRRRMRCRSRRVEIRGRGDLDDLLMPALHRAIALEEVDEIAVLVAEQLHFDVRGALDELLQEDVGTAEGRAGLAPGLVEGRARVGRAHGRRACRGRRRPSTP